MYSNSKLLTQLLGCNTFWMQFPIVVLNRLLILISGLITSVPHTSWLLPEICTYINLQNVLAVTLMHRSLHENTVLPFLYNTAHTQEMTVNGH